jgi:hypothetical protein
MFLWFFLDDELLYPIFYMVQYLERDAETSNISRVAIIRLFIHFFNNFSSYSKYLSVWVFNCFLGYTSYRESVDCGFPVGAQNDMIYSLFSAKSRTVGLWKTKYNTFFVYCHLFRLCKFLILNLSNWEICPSFIGQIWKTGKFSYFGKKEKFLHLYSYITAHNQNFSNERKN